MLFPRDFRLHVSPSSPNSSIPMRYCEAEGQGTQFDAEAAQRQSYWRT